MLAIHTYDVQKQGTQTIVYPKLVTMDQISIYHPIIIYVFLVYKYHLNKELKGNCENIWLNFLSNFIPEDKINNAYPILINLGVKSSRVQRKIKNSICIVWNSDLSLLQTQNYEQSSKSSKWYYDIVCIDDLVI